MIKTSKQAMLRIYIINDEQAKARGFWKWLFPATAHRQLIADARNAGISSAVAYTTGYGYSNRGKIGDFSAELGPAKLIVCVELIDERDKLERFADAQRKLLAGKVSVFTEVDVCMWE